MKAFGADGAIGKLGWCFGGHFVTHRLQCNAGSG